MKASETALFKLLQGQQHFMIPLFQRPYTWDRDDWTTLWNDVVETYEMGNEGRHFLGSVVTKALPATPEGVSPFLVIDGQQRLITITILLAAIRDTLRERDSATADRIQEIFLTNQHTSGLARYKVLPTQVDRQAYCQVIDGHQTLGSDSRIHQAYAFFRGRLVSPGNDDSDIDELDLQELQQVILMRLELVSITLDEDDNEYRIFESLNGKGTPLSQADLIRNYFFMRIPAEDHETAYHELWLPMQELLTDSRLEDFFRYELMSYGSFVRQSDVYHEWKKRLARKTASELVDELLTLSMHSRMFHRIIEPEYEPHPAIRRGLTRLNRWGGQTTYPFILHVYREYERRTVAADGFAQILQFIESFLVRRMFCGVPTNALNRLFLRLPEQLPQDVDIVEGTRLTLSEPTRRWPGDEDFREAILTYPLYTDSRPDQRRLILETLEESFQHRERVDLTALSIEHVMPQTLTPEWRDELGPNADDVHQRFVHVLGNLTLTGYNPELSNRPFSEKRALLRDSNLAMNKEIAAEPVWTAEQIEARGRRLAERAIQVWPGPKR